MKIARTFFAATLAGIFSAGTGTDLCAVTPAEVQTLVEAEMPALLDFYRDIHQHPELSFQEQKTSAKFAAALEKLGYTVTTHVGKFGVVGVLKNGGGPTILLRTELDALPVKEQTGLLFASAVMAKDAESNTVPVMHACGHDLHMTCVDGAAQTLARLTNDWHGTLVIIGQPAEEIGRGARAMLADGLFTKFPKPDFCIALHDSADLPVGQIGFTSGYSSANADSVTIIIHGVGGHGAHPDKTKDPIVLAAKIILSLQTIVSREVEPGEPAVITVGSIHGGTKNNVIPDEVKMLLTVRSYSEAVRQQLIEAIRRVARGEAVAAGLPENLMPEVIHPDTFTRSTYNNPALVARLSGVFQDWFGATNILTRKPGTGAEDFAEYGRTAEKIPSCMFSLGAVKPEAYADAHRTGKILPSLHSSLWAPDAEPALKRGIAAFVAAVLDLSNAPLPAGETRAVAP
jgi:amidohydrolase